MNDLFDFNPKPLRFCVIGNPIEHSLSPQIHHHFARQTNISLDYTKTLGEAGGFNQAVQHFMASGGKGMNITLPFKPEAHALCDELSKRAKFAAAVNTISFKDDKIVGDVTDGQGLVTDIQQNHDTPIKDKRVLIIGAGGAVRGVLQALLEASPKEIIICNRSQGKAMELAGLFSPLGNIRACAMNILTSIAPKNTPFDIVINGTSASLDGALPDVPVEIISNSTFVLDMMYAPQPTIFMKWALNKGAEHVVDGLGMLVEQAAASFEIWHGVKPQTTSALLALKQGV